MDGGLRLDAKDPELARDTELRRCCLEELSQQALKHRVRSTLAGLGHLMNALGVDGCSRGWIAARRGDAVGHLQVLRRDALKDLLGLTPAPLIIAVDVPIGLLPCGSRACDNEARRLLGPRRSSVFPAPLRPTLASLSHSEASTIRRSIEGKGISIQAFGILRKVAEVDGLLSAEPRSRSILREVHPEVCFFFLNAHRPLNQ